MGSEFTYVYRGRQSDVGAEQALAVDVATELGAPDSVVGVAEGDHVPLVGVAKGRPRDPVNLRLLPLDDRLQDQRAANEMSRVANLRTPSTKPDGHINGQI